MTVSELIEVLEPDQRISLKKENKLYGKRFPKHAYLNDGMRKIRAEVFDKEVIKASTRGDVIYITYREH